MPGRAAAIFRWGSERLRAPEQKERQSPPPPAGGTRPGDLLPEREVHHRHPQGGTRPSPGQFRNQGEPHTPSGPHRQVRTEGKGQPRPEAPVLVAPGDTSLLVDVSEEGQRALQGDRRPDADP